jgi:hypothetical protein
MIALFGSDRKEFVPIRNEYFVIRCNRSRVERGT